MLFRQLFDPETSTYTYLIADRTTREAILVDPVIEQVDRDEQLLTELGLTLRYCLETHIHADHITGTGTLRDRTGCSGVAPRKSGIICADVPCDHGDRFTIGDITVTAIATPGHTNCDMSYLINDTHLLTGDSLFIRGCGRTDFQSGDAGQLYDSITQHLFTLPDHVLVYPGHDYRGQTVSTIGEEKQHNPRLAGQSRDQFITLMSGLDLPNPKKIMEAVPANQHCGQVA
ncbi:MBL fold metallo-hydrolase [Spirulina major]|uniref:MBL fold metallo-hydrolase n=1 Tax=Spirulina major TaxID=270636 RepID=UPI00093354BA|nr:MBL fold metallo-hydrolase [Spirulina major]